MTFEECRAQIVSIRRRQGTRCPIVRIDCGGSVAFGRLTRTDTDPEHGHDPKSPFGVLVLEDPGLGRGPATTIQIADIPPGGIQEAEAALAAG